MDIMKKKSKIEFGLLLIFVIGIIFLLSCNKHTSGPDNIGKPVIDWGIGVYPPHGFTNPNPDDWAAAFKTGSRVGNIAHLEVTHDEMSLDDMFMLYDLKIPLAKKYGMETFIQINTFGKIPDPVKYRQEAVEIAKKYKPDYMCLGQEINYVYDDNQKEKYQQFVKDLLITYQEVKKVSPNTKVFPSFAYEPMRAKHQEFLFSDFKDIVPFFPITSYSLKAFDIYLGYLYESPKDIPPDYWNVSDITDKDIFITETGWSTGPHFRGSRQQQVDYVDKVYELIRNNPKVKKVAWILLMDVVNENTAVDYEYPGTMGFFTIDGEEKPAWTLISD